jgi:hypothetical protein
MPQRRLPFIPSDPAGGAWAEMVEMVEISSGRQASDEEVQREQT